MFNSMDILEIVGFVIALWIVIEIINFFFIDDDDWGAGM